MKMHYGFTNDKEWVLITGNPDEALSAIRSSIKRNIRSNPHLFNKEGVPQCWYSLFVMPETLEEKAKETIDHVIKKYGTIYVNRNGGISGEKTLIYDTTASDFPKEKMKPKQWTQGTHWYVGNLKFDSKEEAEHWLKG